MTRRKPEIAGQELLPGSGFFPGELWCILCGGPVQMIWERKFMMCENCNPSTKRHIRGTSKTFKQWLQTASYKKALKEANKLLESTNEEG